MGSNEALGDELFLDDSANPTNTSVLKQNFQLNLSICNDPLLDAQLSWNTQVENIVIVNQDVNSIRDRGHLKCQIICLKTIPGYRNATRPLKKKLFFFNC